MKKALVPLTCSLALCAAAATVVAMGSAHAQTNVRKPMMVAMMPSGLLLAANTATPPVEGAGPPDMRRVNPAEMAARHKQMCQDAYAHQVGDLAYLEAKLNLAAAQQSLFERWRSVKLDIAKRGEADCATRELPSRTQTGPTPLDSMAREEDMLKRRLADLDAERPVLAAFYNTLSAAQKTALLHPGPETMMGRHRMMADALAPHGLGLNGGPNGGPNRGPMPDGPPPQ